MRVQRGNRGRVKPLEKSRSNVILCRLDTEMRHGAGQVDGVLSLCALRVFDKSGAANPVSLRNRDLTRSGHYAECRVLMMTPAVIDQSFRCRVTLT